MSAAVVMSCQDERDLRRKVSSGNGLSSRFRRRFRPARSARPRSRWCGGQESRRLRVGPRGGARQAGGSERDEAERSGPPVGREIARERAERAAAEGADALSRRPGEVHQREGEARVEAERLRAFQEPRHRRDPEDAVGEAGGDHDRGEGVAVVEERRGHGERGRPPRRGAGERLGAAPVGEPADDWAERRFGACGEEEGHADAGGADAEGVEPERREDAQDPEEDRRQRDEPHAAEQQVIVTGGMESMSNAPYLLKKARFGYRLGNGELIDSMVFDGLTSTFDKLHMVQQASKVARELGVSREEQDGWALRSHERAVRAIDEGRFADEIVPVGEFAVDEGPRRDTSLEKLASLKPVFDPEGTTTAGNAPGVNDGAGCVIVASEEFAQRRGLEVLATIVAQGYVADDFAFLARTPAKAGEMALAKAGKSIDDVERVELNEAFSSVVVNSMRMLGADPDKVNVNGGAVALGHPIGASGARILGTMVHELRRNGGGLGLAAICSGGGQGDALLIEV